MTKQLNFTGIGGYSQAATPRIIPYFTTDIYATIIGAGYLNTVQDSNQLLSTDIICASYNAGSGFFTVSIASDKTITLSPQTSSGEVVLPVVSGNFSIFSGTLGTIADLGYFPSNAAKTVVVMANAATIANHLMVSTDIVGTSGNLTGTAINDGSLQAGRNTIAGSCISFPATTTTGSLSLTAVANSGNYSNTISNALTGQATTWSLQDPGAATANILQTATALVSGNIVTASGILGKVVDGAIATNKVLTSGITTPDVGANLVTFSVVCGFANLNSGGSVVLIASSGSKQYRLISLFINKVGTNFSGGGGDRLGQVTDGTSVYSVIPATNMQTLLNAGWGMSTPLPFPASVSINTLTVAGANLSFKYSGGTTDYTSGSVTISGMAERVV